MPEERCQLDGLGGRCDRVAKADIDLDRTPGASQEGDARDPHSHVLRRVADGLGLDRVGGEHKPIGLDRRAADLCERLDEAIRRVRAIAHQIEIARCSVGRVEPHREQHSALQDEPVAVFRLAQPVEEPLQDVGTQEVVERPSCLSAQVQQARLHGCCHIGRRPHASISR